MPSHFFGYIISVLANVCGVNTKKNLEKVHNSECQQTIKNSKILEIAEWSQSQLSIRGQPGTSTFGGQERKHAMRFLFATIQRQSKYDIKGESISFFSQCMYSKVLNKWP